ncbi:hypothetical protein KBJ94_29255 [Pseudomonas sp. ITA]|uniref:hypothetical protein n=1 Tax=Pseudomonas sp. ITA TaxID=2825841 RepID=UPI0024988552|nr:hypothetical protein [Pseudomonas sp. ITA]MDI2146138.1 hypothetical protein [Pseudomonas sp. ITA]
MLRRLQRSELAAGHVPVVNLATSWCDSEPPHRIGISLISLISLNPLNAYRVGLSARLKIENVECVLSAHGDGSLSPSALYAAIAPANLSAEKTVASNLSFIAHRLKLKSLIFLNKWKWRKIRRG